LGPSNISKIAVNGCKKCKPELLKIALKVVGAIRTLF